MRKVKKRVKISRFEKLIYTLAIFLLVISPVSIVFSKATLANINYQVEFKDQNLANNFNVNIALYDGNDTLLEEQTKEYTKEDITSPKIYTISFNLDDTLKLDNIKKYSINITE